MRANVKVVGTGKRRVGVSSTGNNYNFVPVSIVFRDPEYQGFRADTMNIDGPEFDRAQIAADQEYDMVFHYVKGRPYLDAIL